MATISTLNGKTAAVISTVNGKAKSAISTINTHTLAVADSVSVNPTNLYFYASGNPKTNNYTTVTSSGTWGATLDSDPDSIVSGFTTSGGNGAYLYVTIAYNDMYDDASYAIIKVTVGTANAYLYLCRDGNLYSC